MSAQPNLFQPKARARREDPDTSKAAAESVKDITAKQKAVLRLFLNAAGTDEEIAIRYNACRESFGLPVQSPSGLRSRRSELVHLGYLKDSGVRKETMSGRWAIVWMKA